ncbi:MAG: hypothetical protein FAF05_02120 [Epsilonproteobacteria bacterium]|nr:hypothetical protein [Campylobacterota bacterium]
MAASTKAIQNAQRVRYIRALERFHKTIHTFLAKNETITKEALDKKIDNAFKLLSRVEEVQLYKGELQDLQTLVKKMIASKQSDEDIQQIRSDLLYGCNQLDKRRNARKYKKQKHSNSHYEEFA